MSPYTQEEQEISSLIVEAHNKFVGLEPTHPSEINDWVSAIHELQKLLGMRILRREFPALFSTNNPNTKKDVKENDQ